ncbi:MAG: hypothetical protein M1468_02535 [Candidatus Thermoplasmatota archaeon]|jgi:hypothetical protein|nr:hypothetical protein [Candidatus Thermoplasmatota archaeon]
MPIIVSFRKFPPLEVLNSSMVSDIINVMGDSAGFKVRSWEIWEDSTTEMLGGRKIHVYPTSDGEEFDDFTSVIDKLRSGNIIVAKGSMTNPIEAEAHVDFYGTSSEVAVYSDVMIDTEPIALVDILNMYPDKKGEIVNNIFNGFSELKVNIGGREKKLISEIVLSYGIPDDNMQGIDSYHARNGEYNILKKLIVSTRESYENIIPENKIREYNRRTYLFDVKKLSEKIFKIDTVEKIWQRHIGKTIGVSRTHSFSYVSRKPGAFDMFIEDLREQVVYPSIEGLNDSDEVIKRIRDEINKKAKGPIDSFTSMK